MLSPVPSFKRQKVQLRQSQQKTISGIKNVHYGGKIIIKKTCSKHDIGPDFQLTIEKVIQYQE